MATMILTEEATREKAALKFGKDASKVERRLWQAAALLLPTYRRAFGHEARFHANRRMLISSCQRYGLVWQVRNKPDQPIGYENQQLREGIVMFVTIGAFEVNPNQGAGG